MCVRMLKSPATAAATDGTVLVLHHDDNDDDNEDGKKVKKMKEKYVKLYQEITLEVQKEMVREEKLRDFAAKLLTESTLKYGLFFKRFNNIYYSWQQSKFYKIAFGTTQPAHAVMLLAVLCVASALKPLYTSNYGHINSVEKQNQAAGRQLLQNHPHQQHPSTSSALITFIYLTSFVLHLGSQFWMTFVSGLSLYFALPRHAFGEVQRVLFPRYFTLNSFLSLTTLLIFVKHHPTQTTDTQVIIQVIAMSLSFFTQLSIRLYLTEPLVHLIAHKTAMERAAAVGNEIGRFEPGPLKDCPHYWKIHQAFRRIHITIAMGNMFAMALTVLHLHYLAGKLSL